MNGFINKRTLNLNSSKKVAIKEMDFNFFMIALFLLILGTTVLFSSSYHKANIISQDYFFFLKKRLAFIVLAFFVGSFVAIMDISIIKKFVPIALLLTLALVVMSFVPGLGLTQKGGIRWVSVANFSFQPSEFAKLSIILYLAFMLEKKKERDQMRDSISLIYVIFVVILFTLLVYLQNDLSTSIFISVVSFAMLLIAGFKKRFFVFVTLIVVGIGILAIFLVPFRAARLQSYLHPDLDPSGSGFQILNSLKALKNGGLFGVGLGLGDQKLGNIPEVYSDFIFTVVAEELGYVGVLLVFAAFIVFVIKGLSISYYSTTYFNSFLAFGITFSIALQVLLNIAVVSGKIPTTGITLPFFSSGGSSLIITVVMCAILLNLSRYTTEK